MNVFLPYPDYKKSVESLDNVRLNKQILEASQMLQAIDEGGRWANHPATRMYQNCPGALVRYALLACDEAEKRGIRVSKRRTIEFYGESNEDPKWSSNLAIYAGYRSNLLRKGRADAVCSSLKKALKLKSINTWLKTKNMPEKTFLSLGDIEKLEKLANFYNYPIQSNFYSQYNWSERDNLSYIWPV